MFEKNPLQNGVSRNINEYSQDLETRIETETSYLNTKINNKATVVTGTASDRTAAINLPSDLVGGLATYAFAKHPTGGHWVGVGAITSIQMNPTRSVVTVTVDGFYANQEIKVAVVK